MSSYFRLRTSYFLLLPVLLVPQGSAQSPAFTYQKVMIPVRDGVKLETVIMTPANATGPLPILFRRTPYGVPASADVIRAHSLAMFLPAKFANLIGGAFLLMGTFTGLFCAYALHSPPGVIQGTVEYGCPGVTARRISTRDKLQMRNLEEGSLPICSRTDIPYHRVDLFRRGLKAAQANLIVKPASTAKPTPLRTNRRFFAVQPPITSRHFAISTPRVRARWV